MQRLTNIMILLSMCLSCTELEHPVDSTSEWRVPGVVKASVPNALFTAFGPGWTGGDQSTSIPLPDGTTLFLFGDSFIGTVAPDRSRPPGSNTFIRNSAVQVGPGIFTSVYDDSGATPADWLSPPEPDAWYWPADGYVLGSEIYIVCPVFENTGTGIFGFENTRTDIVKVSLSSFEQTGRIKYPSAGVHYGSCVLETTDFIYIYGSREKASGKEMTVSRIDADSPPGTTLPEYWDGTNWSSNPADAAALLSQTSNIYSVFKDPLGSGYRLVSQEDFLSDKIFGYSAPTPWGPFNEKTLLFRTPNDGGDLFTYNASVHPMYINADGKILVGYNINSFDFTDLFSDADTYRPYFAWVPLW